MRINPLSHPAGRRREGGFSMDSRERDDYKAIYGLMCIIAGLCFAIMVGVFIAGGYCG